MLPLKGIWVLKGKFHFLAQKILSVYQILLFLWIECFNLHFPKVRTIRKSLTVKQNFKIQHTHFCFCQRWRKGAWIYFLSEITTRNIQNIWNNNFQDCSNGNTGETGNKGVSYKCPSLLPQENFQAAVQDGKPKQNWRHGAEVGKVMMARAHRTLC